MRWFSSNVADAINDGAFSGYAIKAITAYTILGWINKLAKLIAKLAKLTCVEDSFKDAVLYSNCYQESAQKCAQFSSCPDVS